MARMPGAIWKPLADNWNRQPRMKAYDIFCLHTMVGSLNGTDGYFRVGNGAGYGGAESHFGVGPDGTIFQWQDTDFQADANVDGGWHVISSENADTGAPFPKWGGSDVPAFTPQQVEANARIAAWLNQVHGIPLDIIPDAKVGRRGIGWHRQGVPGYMVAGAERWSVSKGKVCPGDRRIAQAPQIRDRARQIRGGAPATPPAPTGDDDVLTPWQDATLMEIAKRLQGISFAKPGTPNVDSPYVPADSLRLVGLADRQVPALNAELAALRASQKELVATIAKLADGDDLDEDALVARIEQVVKDTVDDAAKLVKVQVSVEDQDAPVPPAA